MTRVLEVGNEMFSSRMNGETITCSNGVEIDVRPLNEKEQLYVSSQHGAQGMIYTAFMLGVTDIRNLTDQDNNPVPFAKERIPNPAGKGNFNVVAEPIRDRMPPIVKTRIAEVILDITGMGEADVAKVNFTSPSSEISS